MKRFAFYDEVSWEARLAEHEDRERKWAAAAKPRRPFKIVCAVCNRGPVEGATLKKIGQIGRAHV